VLITQAELKEEVISIYWPNTRSNIEVAKLQTFNGVVEKVLDFLITYKLYIRIRIRVTSVEK